MRKSADGLATRNPSLFSVTRDQAATEIVCTALTLALLALAFRIVSVW
jgi:hypothetical protein